MRYSVLKNVLSKKLPCQKSNRITLLSIRITTVCNISFTVIRLRLHTLNLAIIATFSIAVYPCDMNINFCVYFLTKKFT